MFICSAQNCLYEDRFARKEKASHLNRFIPIHFVLRIMYFILILIGAS